MIAVLLQAVGHLQIDIYSNTISRIRNNRTTAIKLFNALRIILHNNSVKRALLFNALRIILHNNSDKIATL